MRKVRRQPKSALNLPSITLEGGLFLPDQLEKAALGQATLQTDADYHIPKGLKLKDEYSRAFQIACAQWKHFAPTLERDDVDAWSVTQIFVEELLRDVFSYASIHRSAPISVNERTYPITMVAGHIPVIVAPFNAQLDDGLPEFAIDGSGSRKKSAFQIAQELLNASQEHLWAIVTNGTQLRLLRDAASLTRPSFLEFDLQDVLQGQRFSEFASLWRLLHASRATLDGKPEHSVWEQWRENGKAEGTRVRDGLRIGVEQALLTLGEGFIQHPANQTLRQQLENGEISKNDYFQQLLRLIYRLIFIFTVEERGLLHPQQNDKNPSKTQFQARRAYAQGYALGRLRDACLKHRNLNRFDDQWQSLRIVFAGLAEGENRLDLPALGGLFSPTQCPALDQASLNNLHLLTAMRHLRWATHKGSPAPIDYRNMGSEELGSVYESLLELVPEINLTAKTFGFVGITSEGSTAGNARKTSGSYYTPDSLVQELIKSALEPVIRQRLQANKSNPVEALLNIRVIDPACGSGHFLLAAARRLAQELAQLRTEDGAVKPADYRHALRDVVANCIFGVDRNPMALELARMALWLEGFEEGQPLSFLDHHLQCGDALLGLTDLKALEYGIPKAAFKALSGDEKAVCTALNKNNTSALKQLEKDRKSPQFNLPLEQANQLIELQAIEAMPQNSTRQIAKQEAAYLAFLEKAKHSPLRYAADMLLGAFIMPKTADTEEKIPTTTNIYLELVYDQHNQQHLAIRNLAMQACTDASVFHWPLAYPQVFAQGGFDCVLGNPPWEVVQNRDDAIDKDLHERQKKWFGEGIYSVLSGRRDLYKLFLTVIPHLLKQTGRCGFVLPIGFMFEDDCSELRKILFNKCSVVSILHLQNAQKSFFLDVHASYRFIAMTFSQDCLNNHKFSTVVKSTTDLESISWIEIPRNKFDEVIGENRNAIIFNSQNQATTHELLISKLLKLKQLQYQVVAEFHASSDKEILSLQCQSEDDWKLLKNGSFHHYNPGFAPTEKWVSKSNVEERLKRKKLDTKVWINHPRLVFRDIARNDDTRTLIACLVPPGFVSTYDAPMLIPIDPEQHTELALAFYAGYLSSFLADYLIRPYVDKHIKAYVLSHVPIPRFNPDDILMFNAARLALSLSQEKWYGTNKDNQISLISHTDSNRISLEAMYLKISNATSNEIREIFSSFTGIQKEELNKFDEYRTQRLVLEAWDKLEAGILGKEFSEKPVRRTESFDSYLPNGTPASAAEDWLAGLVCDVILQTGSCDDTRLRLILGSELPADHPDIADLSDWLEPLQNTERWEQITYWLRDLFNISISSPLSINDTEKLSAILGDRRTESLARALIHARILREQSLSGLLVEETETPTETTIKRG